MVHIRILAFGFLALYAKDVSVEVDAELRLLIGAISKYVPFVPLTIAESPVAGEVVVPEATKPA